METQTENRLMDMSSVGEEGEGEANGDSSKEAYTLPHVKYKPIEICCMTQGTQTGAL